LLLKNIAAGKETVGFSEMHISSACVFVSNRSRAAGEVPLRLHRLPNLPRCNQTQSILTSATHLKVLSSPGFVQCSGPGQITAP
jgi:hypothetical protein